MIDRAVRLAQATSSMTSVIVLVAVNLIPLAGVLFFHWNVATLLVLYWVENGIIGILNVPKILLAEGPPSAAQAPKVAVALFFLVHYGLFWFVHGVFVLTLPMFVGLSGAADPGLGGVDLSGPTVPPGFPLDLIPGVGPDSGAPSPAGLNVAGIAIGAIGLAISHSVSFVINFLGRREYRKVSPAQQAQAPYGRLLILHLAIILGAIVSMLIGSPIGAVVVLVLLKTAVDLRFHNEEHRRLTARPAPA